MRRVTASNIPLELDQYENEWATLCAQHHNVLLEGSAAATDAALLLLHPHLRPPVTWCQPGAPVQLPNRDAGAIVLRDVGALSASDQARLLAWTRLSRSRTQIVSTTEGPLFALVVRGLFNETLYYRLNIMLLHVEPNAPTGSVGVLAERSRRPVGSAISVPAPQFVVRTS
jgi:sigma54-dependent transcription regulator